MDDRTHLTLDYLSDLRTEIDDLRAAAGGEYTEQVRKLIAYGREVLPTFYKRTEWLEANPDMKARLDALAEELRKLKD